MAANQCGFDVASKKEMEQVLKYVSDTERIVFANPCKLNSHIKYAAGLLAKIISKQCAYKWFINLNKSISFPL